MRIAIFGLGYVGCVSNASLVRLTGANREYIERAIPHVSSLLCPSLDEVLDHAQVLVIGNRSSAFAEVVRRAGNHVIIDLVRVGQELSEFGDSYEGICW